MTFEKRCLIETEDIIGIQYECGKCHAAYLVPIERINPDKFAAIAMNACLHCGEKTGLLLGTNDMKTFLEFNEALAKIADVMKGRNLKLRLNIKCAE